MEKKDVLLIVNYWHFENERASSRYRSFADVICKTFDLEVITSTFCHLKKSQRIQDELDLGNLPYKVTMQYEKGYSKNISLRRISSYTQFGKNVLKYLKTRKKPDCIIVSVPSLAVADYVTKFAKDNNIPLIVDIQDLWPEAFKMALNIPIVSNILFHPMKKQAERIYSRADEIIAVSDTYRDLGCKYNAKCSGLSIYIGTDSRLMKEKISGIEISKPKNEFWVGYVGALGHSYDIKNVILALEKIAHNGITNIVFKVMGEGVLRKDFENFAIEHKVNCEFYGLVEYGKMMKILMSCDVAVNPIIGKSVSTIINKVSDYAAAGVPVVNTQNSQEYRMLIKKYNAGINAETENADSIADALLELYQNPDKRQKMGINQKKLFEERFDRAKTYTEIINVIDNLIITKRGEQIESVDYKP